jgi:hypothetical protein
MDSLLQMWGKERGVPGAEKGRRKIKKEGLYTSRIDMIYIWVVGMSVIQEFNNRRCMHFPSQLPFTFVD